MEELVSDGETVDVTTKERLLGSAIEPKLSGRLVGCGADHHVGEKCDERSLWRDDPGLLKPARSAAEMNVQWNLPQLLSQR